jgi:hypothetical protein
MAQATVEQTGELVLGRYRPLSPIGSGGSGSVWLARDELSGREIALKIVTREGKAGSRAEREVAAAAKLHHPRCLRVLDHNWDDQHVYIAYEYVDGKTLRQRLREGELDDRHALEACAQILDALDHAHRQGIVHRDVKPANVLLAGSEEIDVRLVDFGLAQFNEAETLTALGDIPGTLAYISPERLHGGSATSAADVWAVGVILWESLAGWHPFWNGSMLETAKKIESGAAPLATLRPDLPRLLLAAIDRALHLDPAERPSAAALAKVLRSSIPRRERARQARPVSLGRSLHRPSPGRFSHALLAGVIAFSGAALFPFYPPGYEIALTLGCGLLALFAPRAGAAAVLLSLVLPLGNYSLGLAIAFAVASVAWLMVNWREPRVTLTPALGPLLAPFGALFLLPLVLLPVRNAARRAAAAALAFLVATTVAGLGERPLPLTNVAAPHSLGIEGSSAPGAVAGALLRAVADRPALVVVSTVLALAAALLPYARRYGLWGIAALSAVTIALALVPAPSVSAGPVIAGVWLTAIVLSIGRSLPTTGSRANGRAAAASGKQTQRIRTPGSEHLAVSR